MNPPMPTEIKIEGTLTSETLFVPSLQFRIAGDAAISCLA